ncbi:restriction endonuclease [Agrobacterium tumefaciens]|uniref:restriction endonuclease n=1 Tax=Agrobacterium tumefaciens TaxID=358 RepID=UPI0022077531|nr:restriction endonuclease [Agrobacterium tumefaciens]
MTESTEFEKLQNRIFSLISADAQSVDWNARIEDPDTGAPRQIDVLIVDKSGRRIDVECRLHDAVQDVKWIEELIGRRSSLRMDDMIAVSNSGFTRHAVKKAAAFNIGLYDIDVISDDDIKSWLNRPEVKARFLTFDRLDVVPVVSMESSLRISETSCLTRNGRDGLFAVMALLRNVVQAEHCDGRPIRATLPVEGFLFGDEPLRYMVCQFSVQTTNQHAQCTRARLQGAVTESRDINISNFAHSVPEILEFRGKVSVIATTEALKIPPNSILDCIEVAVPNGRELLKREFNVGRMVSQLDSVRILGVSSDEDLTPSAIWSIVANTPA